MDIIQQYENQLGFWRNWAEFLSHLLFDKEGNPIKGYENIAENWEEGREFDYEE